MIEQTHKGMQVSLLEDFQLGSDLTDAFLFAEDGEDSFWAWCYLGQTIITEDVWFKTFFLSLCHKAE